MEYKMNNLKFYYSKNSPIGSKNIINTKECIKNIDRSKNFQGDIDYRFALQNITLFENLAQSNIKTEITIVNLHDEIIDTYKDIFNFIANGGKLIYHTFGIVKKQKPQTIKKLATKREILKDLKHVWHGCIIEANSDFYEERKICSLIFKERQRLKLFLEMPPYKNQD
jgi:sulfur carrier protein ThiS